MAEDVHRRLHHRNLEAAAALAKLVERTHRTLVETRELGVVAGLRKAQELERCLGPVAGQRRGIALGTRGEVRPHHVVARAADLYHPIGAKPLAHVLAQTLEE